MTAIMMREMNITPGRINILTQERTKKPTIYSGAMVVKPITKNNSNRLIVVFWARGFCPIFTSILYRILIGVSQ
jgi:hypothetical protein